jgi:hypothetical protein
MSSADPIYGPLYADPTFSGFFDISAEAFGVYSTAMANADCRDPLVFLYSRFGYLAENTSWSARLLVSWDAPLPAIALGRVRLEQIVVCSYLIHEDTDAALTPYLMHYPIDSYKSNKEAIKNAQLKHFLSEDAHDATFQAAFAAKQRIDATFDGSISSLNRSKWTELDLLSMAKRRDMLTKDTKNISRYPLELSYLSFYRDFSSMVHSGSLSISPEFVALAHTEDGHWQIAANPIWPQYLMMTLSTWDILHVFELLSAMEIDREVELKALHSRWLARRDAFFAEKDRHGNA